MPLGTRELLLVVRARDEASRVLGKVSTSMLANTAAANAAMKGVTAEQLASMRTVEAERKKTSAEAIATARATADAQVAAMRKTGVASAAQIREAKAVTDAQVKQLSVAEAARAKAAASEIRSAENLSRAQGRRMEAEQRATRNSIASQRAIGNALTTTGIGAAAAGALLGAFYVGSAKKAIAYNQEAAKTLTQVDQTGVKLQTIEEIGTKVANAIPAPFEQMQGALYDIFSSMDVSVKGSQTLLTGFAKAAVAGQTDMQTAARGTIYIMNAYHLGANQVNRVNDIMFQLVRKGVGTYTDFARTIGLAVPQARQAGQSLENLAGMMAFMTRNGLSASRAATSAGRALQMMVHPKAIQGFKELGINVADAHGHFRSIVQVAGELHDKLQGLTPKQQTLALFSLFKGTGQTVQGMRFWSLAVKNFGSLNELTKAMVNSTGSMQHAYDIMLKQPQTQLQLLTNKWNVFRTMLGEAFIPVLIKIVGWFDKILNWFNNLSPHTRNLIAQIGIITSILLVVGGVIATVVGGIMLFVAAISAAGIALSTVGLVIGIVVAALVAIGAAVYFTIKYWKDIPGFFQHVWQDIKNWFWDGVHSSVNAVMWLVNTVTGFFVNMWHDVVGFARRLWSDVTSVFTGGRGMGGGIMNAIAGPFVAAFGYVDRFVQHVWHDIAQWTSDGVRAVENFFQPLVNFWDSHWTEIRTIAVTTFQILWAQVKIWLGIIEGAFKIWWSVMVSGFQIGMAIIKAVWNVGWAAIKVVAQLAWDNIVTFFRIGWTVLKTVTLVGWDILKMIWNVGFAIIKGMVINAWIAIRAAFIVGWNVIKAVSKVAWEVLVLGFQVFWNTFKMLARVAWAVIEGIFKIAWHLIELLFGVFLDVLTGHWGKAWRDIKNYGNAIWHDIYGIFKGVWRAMSDWFHAILTALKNFFIRIWHDIWNAMRSIATTVWSALRSFLQNSIHAFSSVWHAVWNGIKSVFGTVWHGIRDVGVTAWNGLKRFLSDAIHGFAKVWSTVWNGIKNTFNTVWTGIKRVAGSIWGDIKGFFTNGINDIIGIINWFIGAIDHIPGVHIGQIAKIGQGGGGGGGPRSRHGGAAAGPGGGAYGGVMGGAFAGVLPGYAPGRDTELAVLAKGEGVLVPEAVRGLGPQFVHWANRHFSSRRGRTLDQGGAALPHFAGGGILGVVGDIGKAIANVMNPLSGGPIANIATATANILAPAIGGAEKMMGGLAKDGGVLPALAHDVIHGIESHVKGIIASFLSGGASNPTRDAVIKYAEKFLGTPYVWGGSEPGGFDCSGLTSFVLRHFHINAPRTAHEQQGWATPETRQAAMKADLAFWGRPAHHVAFWLGNGQILQAPHSGANVEISSVNQGADFAGFGRPVGLGGFGPMGSLPTGGGSASANRNLAMRIAAQMGVPFGPVDYIFSHESGYNNLAQNPRSSAFGIAQFLDSTWGAYGGKTTNPARQIQDGIRYMENSYGSVQAAASHWAQWHSYDKGGRWYSGTGGVNTAGKTEVVFTEDQWGVLSNLAARGASQGDQYITVNTHEINPRAHAAALGWELRRRST
jgi:TP901 family phage tail tape measure protein